MTLTSDVSCWRTGLDGKLLELVPDLSRSSLNLVCSIILVVKSRYFTIYLSGLFLMINFALVISLWH